MWQQDVVATIVAVAIHALAIGFLLMNLQMSGALDTQPTVAEPIPAEMVDEMATREELTRQAAEERHDMLQCLGLLGRGHGCLGGLF